VLRGRARRPDAGGGNGVTQPPLRRIWEYSASDGVATAISLAGIVVVVRVLRVDDFGVAEFLRTIQLLFGGVIATPLFDAAGRFYFEAASDDERRRILGGAMTGVLVAGIAAALLVGGSLPWWGPVTRLDIQPGAVWLACLGIPANNLVMAATQTAVLRGASWIYAGLVLTQACASLGAILVLVVWRGAGLEGYLLAVTIGATITAVAGIIVQRRNYRWGRLAGPLKAYVAFGLPYTVTGVVQYAHALFIRVLIARVMSTTALGWYALAERIQGPLRLVISATGKVWMPWLFTTEPARYASVGHVVFRLNGVVLGVQCLLIAFLPEVIRFLGGEAYAPAYTAALLLLVASWVHFLGDWIVSSTLAVAKDTKHRIVVQVVAVAVAVPVALVAVPRWGSAGAAASILIASVTTLAGMLIVVARAYPLRFGLSRLLPVSGLVIAGAILASAQVHLGAKIALVAGSALMWAAGFLHLRRVQYRDG